ncbi:hypothetical protein [Burkholderia pyrrocinia]|uniref:hypothetical protein n=1 Tax=Burkholderia pyrrocinia TaxID=60550 RepID=UPI00158E9FAB|nr:hypothetical protein [Burkholderia pyrrocinia]
MSELRAVKGIGEYEALAKLIEELLPALEAPGTEETESVGLVSRQIKDYERPAINCPSMDCAGQLDLPARLRKRLAACVNRLRKVLYSARFWCAAPLDLTEHRIAFRETPNLRSVSCQKLRKKRSFRAHFRESISRDRSQQGYRAPAPHGASRRFRAFRWL